MTTTTAGHSPSTGGQIARLFAVIGTGFSAFAEAHARLSEFKRLQDLSDAQLAAKGLSRGLIVNHVFRDRTTT